MCVAQSIAGQVRAGVSTNPEEQPDLHAPCAHVHTDAHGAVSPNHNNPLPTPRPKLAGQPNRQRVL